MNRLHISKIRHDIRYDLFKNCIQDLKYLRPRKLDHIILFTSNPQKIDTTANKFYWDDGITAIYNIDLKILGINIDQFKSLYDTAFFIDANYLGAIVKELMIEHYHMDVNRVEFYYKQDRIIPMQNDYVF